MKLDNDTKTLLGYGNAISLRPQDFNEGGYDMCSEDQWIFDEEWDFHQYDAFLPEMNKNYLFWFQEKMRDSIEVATADEETYLHLMEAMIKKGIDKPDSFQNQIWIELCLRTNDLLRN